MATEFEYQSAWSRIASYSKLAQKHVAAERGLTDICVASAFIKVIEYGTVHRDSITNAVLDMLVKLELVEGNSFISATAFGYEKYEHAKMFAPLGRSSHPQAWPFPR